jgi:signal transduction histidine kinase
VGLGLGHAFSRVTLRPLRLIAETANRIRSDNLTERIPAPEGRDELATLVRLLNQMFDRLQAAFEQVGRFAADVSHEVKTPLSLIRLNAERLRGRVAADPEAAAAVAEILEEIERINHVADRLLFLARAESGALQCTLRPAAVSALLGPLAEDAQVLAADRGVRLVVEAAADAEIRADAGLLRQLLLNVLSNAISVTPPNGEVRLRSAPVDGGWRFEVLDEGPGLPPEQLARLFERFVRFDRRDGGARPGHGLGLAISRSIAQLHGGSIRAENRADRSGLRIEVELPA